MTCVMTSKSEHKMMLTTVRFGLPGPASGSGEGSKN